MDGPGDGNQPPGRSANELFTNAIAGEQSQASSDATPLGETSKRSSSAASLEPIDAALSKRSKLDLQPDSHRAITNKGADGDGLRAAVLSTPPEPKSDGSICSATGNEKQISTLKDGVQKAITGIEEDSSGNLIITTTADCDALASELISDIVGGLVRGDADTEDELDSDEEGHVAAVLGASSDIECSYPQGYVKRQALYSCNTCYAQSKEVAGVCLGCTFSCHEGHDLVEMYTKRNFRCDCGNSKFTGLACKLVPEKEIVNELNLYNQNFVNSYCVCRRPYPDEAVPDKVQVQCLLCEDWFHLEHVLKDLTNMEQKLDEVRTLVCAECRRQHPFLNYYVAEEDDEVAVFDAHEPNCQIDGCGLKFLKAKFAQLPAVEEAAWTTIDWYHVPCTCDACKAMYKDENVEFLLDEEESVGVYEERGREARAAEKALEALDPLQIVVSQIPNRFAQIEFASDVNRLRESIRDKMADWAQKGQVVGPSDVHEFFEGLREQRERERQRRDGPDA